MNDKLSRRYFTKLFTFGAVAVAVGGHAVLAAKEAVSEALPDVPEGARVVFQSIETKATKLRATWTAIAKPDLNAIRTIQKGPNGWFFVEGGGDAENPVG